MDHVVAAVLLCAQLCKRIPFLTFLKVDKGCIIVSISQGSNSCWVSMLQQKDMVFQKVSWFNHEGKKRGDRLSLWFLGSNPTVNPSPCY